MKIKINKNILKETYWSDNITYLNDGKEWEVNDNDIKIDGDTLRISEAFLSPGYGQFIKKGNVIEIAFRNSRFYRLYDFLENYGKKGFSFTDFSKKNYKGKDPMPTMFASEAELLEWAHQHHAPNTLTQYQNNRTGQIYHTKNPAAVSLGKLGGQAGKGKPKQRPEGYYSTIAKLPRKRKSANL